MGAGNTKDVLGPEVSPQHGPPRRGSKNWAEENLPWKQASNATQGRQASKGDTKQVPQRQQQQQQGRNAKANKKDSKGKNNSRDRGGDNEADLDNHIQEIVNNVDNVDAKEAKTRKKRRVFGFFGRSPVAPKEEVDAKATGARSAPEATRLPAVEGERKGSAPVTAPVGNGKKVRRPGTRHGHRRQSVVNVVNPPEQPTNEEEEWEYQQVVVEGFDPEKFKKANVTKKPAIRTHGFQGLNLGPLSEDGLGSLSHASDPLVLRIRKAEKQQLAVPPAYDVTEEQLMKSIEKEFNMT